MMRDLGVPVLAALGVLLGTVWADDAAVVAELKRAGIAAGKSRTGGCYVNVRSAADLKEEVWKGLESMDLRSFSLQDASAFGDEQLARLCGIKSIEVLFFGMPHVTDRGLAALGRLPRLREFVVHHLMGKDVFRGAGLIALKDTPTFEVMEFGGATIDDKGMDAIGQLSHLKRLGIYHAEITAVGFPNLAKLTNLEKLSLEPTFDPTYTGTDLRHLSNLKNLKELLLKKIVLPYEDGLSNLAGMKQLRKLTFVECGIENADLTRLKNALPETSVEFTSASAADVARWHKRLEQFAGAREYYPLHPGTKWVYVTPEGKEETRLVGKTRTIGDKEYSSVKGGLPGQPPGKESFILGLGAGIWVYDEHAREDVPWLRFPLERGRKWGSHSGSGDLQSEVLGEEEVDVPAGRFASVKVRTTFDGSGRKGTLLTWYAKGVGEVRCDFTVELGGQTQALSRKLKQLERPSQR